MKHITKRLYRCPECEELLPTDFVKQIKADALFEFRSAVGSAFSEKKRRAAQTNIAAVNASYTPEKRREAAVKRNNKKQEEDNE